MKRVLLLAFVVLSFSSCTLFTDAHRLSTGYFIYRNECSVDISMRIYTTSKIGDVFSIELVMELPIPQGRQDTLELDGHGSKFNPPLHSYLVVSDGAREVLYTYGPMHHRENYEIISEDEWSETLLYVFTDDVFEGGKPVAPGWPENQPDPEEPGGE